MNIKNKSMSTAVLALFLTSMFVFAAVPIGLSYGDDPIPDPEPDVTIHVGQEYEYTPVFNIKNVDVEAESDKPLTVSITKDGSNDGIVAIKGLLVGTATVTVTGTSQHITSNTNTQTFTVEVLAALGITTEELTFYKDVAGSERQVKPDDNPDIEYSAQGLPAGLHMDASGSGLIYGMATTVGTTQVTVTATNTKTTWTVTKTINIIVVDNGSDFTLTADENVATVTGDARFFVLGSDDTFSFKIDTVDISGTWSVIASEAFSGEVEYTIDETNKKIIFTPTDANFAALSGDYVVYFGHEVNGAIAVEHVIIHFQTDLAFDTKPIASFVVGYETTLVEVGVVTPSP